MELAKMTDVEMGVVSPVVVRVPGWEQFAWLRAGFSTRHSGWSTVYGDGELNLGWTGEDDAAVVARNREAFVRTLAGEASMRLVTVGQVHGSRVRVAEGEDAPLMTGDGRARLEGDGVISRSAGFLLAILTADCVPVLVADTRLRAVGAFHAGWRGTLARIVQHGVASMGEQYGSQPKDLVAAIGPCIGGCCFEVGSEVREAFVEGSADASALFAAHGTDKSRMDLVEANRKQLAEAGVRAGAIWVAGECTACTRNAGDQRKFFSYRGEHGVTGRMLSGVGVAG